MRIRGEGNFLGSGVAKVEDGTGRGRVGGKWGVTLKKGRRRESFGGSCSCCGLPASQLMEREKREKGAYLKAGRVVRKFGAGYLYGPGCFPTRVPEFLTIWNSVLAAAALSHNFILRDGKRHK